MSECIALKLLSSGCLFGALVASGHNLLTAAFAAACLVTALVALEASHA